VNEFEIIRRYFNRATGGNHVTLGIGDDAAVVSVPAGQELVLAMDTFVSGVHFPESTAAADIGWKALAVNLSDLAAMGAQPYWATLSLTLPEADEGWLRAFTGGFFELADRYGVALVGGDLCRGPLAVTVQAHGLVPMGQALPRSGARPGDEIYVTGSLGDAGYALRPEAAGAKDSGYFRERLDRPVPRVEAGLALRDRATSAIDISDGLLVDLGHVLAASGHGARIDCTRLPISPALAAVLGVAEARRLAQGAGDDYELCFTSPPAEAERLARLANELALPLTLIGVIEAEAGIRGINDEQSAGYRHF